MREHKYKAKSQHSDEWVFGSLVITDDNTNNPMQQRLPRKRHQIMTYCAGDWNMGGWSLQDVYSETICEFTGLKDKNGVETFEGDICIVKMTYQNYGKYLQMDDASETIEHKCICVFRNGAFKAGYEFVNRKKAVCFQEFPIKNCEVIGNIHDNPELLTNK